MSSEDGFSVGVYRIIFDKSRFRSDSSFIVERIFKVACWRFCFPPLISSISAASWATQFWRWIRISEFFSIACLNVLIRIMVLWEYPFMVSRRFILKMARCTALCIPDTSILDINISCTSGFVEPYITRDNKFIFLDIPQLLSFALRIVSIKLLIWL